MSPPKHVVVSQSTPCIGSPPIFADTAHAIQWAVSAKMGAYPDIDQATEAYNALQRYYPNIYPFWLREVAKRLQTRKG